VIIPPTVKAKCVFLFSLNFESLRVTSETSTTSISVFNALNSWVLLVSRVRGMAYYLVPELLIYQYTLKYRLSRYVSKQDLGQSGDLSVQQLQKDPFCSILLLLGLLLGDVNLIAVL
jgi:hypothetical protein